MPELRHVCNADTVGAMNVRDRGVGMVVEEVCRRMGMPSLGGSWAQVGACWHVLGRTGTLGIDHLNRSLQMCYL